MTGQRWYDIAEKEPPKDGRYWVYPYYSLDGDRLVTMSAYEKGKWAQTTRPQDYAYWTPIMIPAPPKVKNYKSSEY